MEHLKTFQIHIGVNKSYLAGICISDSLEDPDVLQPRQFDNLLLVADSFGRIGIYIVNEEGLMILFFSIA